MAIEYVSLPQALYWLCENNGCSEKKSVLAKELVFLDGPNFWCCEDCLQDMIDNGEDIGDQLLTLGELLSKHEPLDDFYRVEV